MWRPVVESAAFLRGEGHRVPQRLRAAGLRTLEGDSVPHVTQKQIRAVLDSNKYKYSVGHASFVLQCPFCGEQRKGSGRTMFLNKTTGGVVCKPCDVRGKVTCPPLDMELSLALICRLVVGLSELGVPVKATPPWPHPQGS